MVCRYLMIYGHWIYLQLLIYLKLYVLSSTSSYLSPFLTLHLFPSSLNLLPVETTEGEKLTVDYIRSRRNEEFPK